METFPRTCPFTCSLLTTGPTDHSPHSHHWPLTPLSQMTTDLLTPKHTHHWPHLTADPTGHSSHWPTDSTAPLTPLTIDPTDYSPHWTPLGSDPAPNQRRKVLGTCFSARKMMQLKLLAQNTNIRFLGILAVTLGDRGQWPRHWLQMPDKKWDWAIWKPENWDIHEQWFLIISRAFPSKIYSILIRQ